MKVKAVKLGYYNLKRRKPGEVFELFDESHFSDCNRGGMREIKDREGKAYKVSSKPGWMKRVDDSTPCAKDKLNVYEESMKPTLQSGSEPVSLSGKRVPKKKVESKPAETSVSDEDVI